MQPAFIHLRLHSEYSIVDGIVRVDEAVAAAKPPADPRAVITSVILTEVADGTWGASGVLWRLPDFAKAAGFKHLQHLVPA